MAVKLQTLEEVVQKQGVKILVHGQSGAGKTRLCATCPGNTLIISAEAGLLSIQDEKGDITVAEVNSIDDIMEVYTILKSGTEFDWVCMDSISEIGEVILANEKSKTKDPRQAYGALIDQMGDLVRAFRDLPYNILMTAKQERIKDDAASTMLYMPSMPGAKLAQQMPYWFDEVFAYRVERNTDDEIVRVLQTERDVTHEAKDRSGRLEAYEEPNIAEIENKIKGETKPKLKTVTGE